MSAKGIRLRHLSFHGPNRKPAAVGFGPGLNVIYGASDTGKSFIVESIDFMMGGKPPLTDIPERTGYDRILLGLENLQGEAFTLQRSTDGGRFRLYTGLHEEPPPDDIERKELADQHNERNNDNVSAFLLDLCGLAGKRVRRNKAGDTNNLSFRNLARFAIVTETEITAKRTPLSDGNPVADTPNFSTFKLLLTGADDSALVSRKPASPEEQSREAQAELLDQLADDYRARLKELTKHPDDLEDQSGKLENSLAQHVRQLATTEAEYRGFAERRRELRARLEEGRDRRGEITSLLERFRLLEAHYASDISRLKGIEEAGTLFTIFGQAPCPLCGAEPAYHQREADCAGNIEAVVVAARSEIAKITLLRQELKDTVETLAKEGAGFDRRIPKIVDEVDVLSDQIERLISPKLAKMRATYAELADKRGEVREALAIKKSLQEIQRRQSDIDKENLTEQGPSVADGDLPTFVASKFAKTVEGILKDWHFPEAESVYFESKTRDLVIAGKQRTARGKGLRAITHAAFTVGLLDFCRINGTPHPGFTVLDSPLLAYREPEGADDDLGSTDLDVQFYDYLKKLSAQSQVIIVENKDPPDNIKSLPNVAMFTRNPEIGRYGFFPLPEGGAKHTPERRGS